MLDAAMRRAALIGARDHLFNARSELCRAEEHGLVAIVDTLRELIKELECSTASP